MTETTGQAPPIPGGATSTPRLLEILTNETEAPEWTLMTEAHRTELVERLIARAGDAHGLDWEYIRTHD
jgi:hypothetical protein